MTGNVALESSPSRSAELTVAFLQHVLTAAATEDHALRGQRVTSFSWKPLEVGVISEVVAVQVQLQDETTNASTSRELIAKFLRPEFPLERMFVVESNFYQGFVSPDVKHRFPFALPNAVFLSKQLIIMQRVEAVATYSCVDGCPHDQILNVVAKLAQMHGRFWNADCSELSPSAGIGSELTGEAKREGFPQCWQSFLDDVPLSDDERVLVARLCEKLCEKPDQLAHIHDAVATGPSTLIHGDFHTANLMFPQSSASPTDTLWLVDWATCGAGNPMRDLAFLFIVGVRSDHRAALEATAIQLYFETIQKEGITHLTMDDWKRQYRMCVLNQLLILAVYDSLSKQLASNAKTEKLRQELHAHFCEVNVRACRAALEHFDENEVAQL